MPAELTDGEYHELADEYLEVVLAQVEALAEKNEAIEVEYSVCPCLPPPIKTNSRNIHSVPLSLKHTWLDSAHGCS